MGLSYYIFQGNPERFDIAGYLDQAVSQNEPIIRWLVSRYSGEIAVGDTVFLWRSQGSNPKEAGVIGMAKVLFSPQEMDDGTLAGSFWKGEKGEGLQTRVELELTSVNTGSKQFIKRDWMGEDPVLSDLGILKMASGTNFPITQKQGTRLKQLVENTGRSWSKPESTAGLWLYNQLTDKPIARNKDSEVAKVAVQIGRAVTGVYNKVMNFRAIDPRDDRKGMAGAAKIDHQVWANYFDVETNTLNTETLNSDYQRVWGSVAKTSDKRRVTKEPKEAVDDDVAEKRLAAITRRRGQPAFRKRLLYLYDHKCAVTGVDVDMVLDAAHIVSHATSGDNSSDNGILLRSDLHDLFDAGLLVIDPDSFRVCIDDSVTAAEYRRLDECVLRERVDGSQPNSEYLAQKNRSGA